MACDDDVHPPAEFAARLAVALRATTAPSHRDRLRPLGWDIVAYLIDQVAGRGELREPTDRQSPAAFTSDRMAAFLEGTARCERCVFFRAQIGGRTGWCLRFPPNVRVPESDSVPAFPTVGLSDWCGEFQSRTEARP